jgi:proline iminopeptidase
MAGLYPELEPFEDAMLDVGDGQHVYWEICGNPSGKPAVVLHGGPGSGCTPEHRRFFDPAAYRIVLFDQRGAGRSEPQAGEATVDLSTNTTQHLIADIEVLREHLGVDRWLVWGYSWGSTLALAYAEHHPDRVTEAVLGSVTMSRPAEIQWLYRGVGRFFPEQWRRFQHGVLGPRARR